MIAGLILSGGFSSRMGQPKALLPLGGTTLVERLLALFDRFCEQTVVVTGAHHAEIAAIVPASRLIFNPRFEDGMFSSLQCGLAALPAAQRLLFSPVDFAAVSSNTLQRLFAAPLQPVVKPRFAGKSGHPVLLSHPALEALRAAPRESNAKEVLSRLPAHYVDVDDPFVAFDCDTPHDYQQILASWRYSE